MRFRTLYNIAGVLVTTFTAALAWQQFRWRRINGDSRAVAAWTPGARSVVQVGPVAASVTGDEHAQRAYVLLHGLNTTGVYFGSAWDRLADGGARLVVPDLPGFGHSLDRTRSADDHSIERAAEAIQACLATAVDPHAKVTVAAHSMGSLVALRLADLPASRIDSIVLFAPTLHDSVAEAERHVADRGTAARIFALDRWSSRMACRNICTRPWLARWLARTIAPAMPTGIADCTHMHSWESHVGTLRSTFARREWREELEHLRARGVHVTICVGGRDNAIDRDLIAAIPGIGEDDCLRLVTRAEEGHQLPLTAAEWCVDMVRAVSAGVEAGPVDLVAQPG